MRESWRRLKSPAAWFARRCRFRQEWEAGVGAGRGTRSRPTRSGLHWVICEQEFIRRNTAATISNLAINPLRLLRRDRGGPATERVSDRSGHAKAGAWLVSGRERQPENPPGFWFASLPVADTSAKHGSRGNALPAPRLVHGSRCFRGKYRTRVGSRNECKVLRRQYR